MASPEQVDISPVEVMFVAQTRGFAQSRGSREFFLIAVLALSGLVDLFHLIKLGEVSVLAIFTILYAFLSWCLWLTQGQHKRRISPVLRPFLFFLAWVVSSFIWFRPTLLGLQNVLVLVVFAGVASLSENTISNGPYPPTWVGRTLVVATLSACSLYVIFLLLDGLGTDLVFHARSFAIFVLLGLSWFLAGWRYGSKRSLIYALFIVALIVLSLSRMALAAALLIFFSARIALRSARDWLRLAFVGTLMLATLYVLLSTLGPLRARFQVDADLPWISEEQARDYTSGRLEFWMVTLNSSLDSPWIGHGAGSAASLVSEIWPEIQHPHDEYLRVLHDYGLVGLILFLFSIGRLFRVIRQNWLSTERSGKPEASLHLAAFLALLAVSFTMLTENSLVYLFMMAPLGVLVGASLGARKERVVQG